MTINAIFACDENMGIGKDNDLPWERHDADMLWFKNNTKGHVIVMGRKTWESIGSKKLPKRVNVVVSNKTITGADKVVSGDISEILHDLEKEYPDLKIWIIGGADLYRQTLPYCEGLYVTKFKESYDCDTFIQPTWIKDFKVLASKDSKDAKYIILSKINT